MAVQPIDQGIVTWGGFAGAPGYSIFYATPGQAVLARIREFFEGLKALIPSPITMTFPSSGKTIDATNGQWISSWTGTNIPPVNCTGTGVHSALSGGMVTWNTQTLHRGHLIRGRTFLVPLIGACYDAFGTLEPGTVAALQQVADGLVNTTSGHLLIYSRHGKDKNGVSFDGTFGGVTLSHVSNRVTVQKGRR